MQKLLNFLQDVVHQVLKFQFIHSVYKTVNKKTLSDSIFVNHAKI